MSYLEDSAGAIAGFEGTVHWMYQDGKGNVTVGVGKELPDAVAAARLPLRHQVAAGADPDHVAPAEEITADFCRVAALLPDKLPHYYFSPEALVLTPQDVQTLLVDTLTDLDGQLVRIFDGYARWPAPAKLAMLDMGYNLGVSRLQYEYVNFCAAARCGNFGEMAARCGRNSHDPAFNRRNGWTRSQFLAAAQ